MKRKTVDLIVECTSCSGTGVKDGYLVEDGWSVSTGERAYIHRYPYGSGVVCPVCSGKRKVIKQEELNITEVLK